MAALLRSGKKVINSGVILAPPAALIRHIDAIVDEMWTLGGRHDRWMVGVDQAAHMLVVYRNRTATTNMLMQPNGAQLKGARKVTRDRRLPTSLRRHEPRFQMSSLSPRAIGPVLHVSDVDPNDYRIDEHGVVRPTAADTAASTMVHQWNRAPDHIEKGIHRVWADERAAQLVRCSTLP